MAKSKSEATGTGTPTLDFLRAIVAPFQRLGISATTELERVSTEAEALEYVIRWPGPVRLACANRRQQNLRRR